MTEADYTYCVLDEKDHIKHSHVLIKKGHP